MAFQADTDFSGFLRGAARSAAVEVAGPAHNFLLEERVPLERESDFLSFGSLVAVVRWDRDLWLDVFGNHFVGRIAVPTSASAHCSTFSDANLANHLTGLESHRDVIRMESVAGLWDLSKTEFSTLADLADALHSLCSERSGGPALDPDKRVRLAKWLDAVNKKRDARPMFAAPFGEVEPLLPSTDWATRVRNALALAHLGGLPGKPLSVVLMRYNLSRVETEAAKLTHWAATPTVLEAGNLRGPNSTFFPFPRAAQNAYGIAFGTTVSLGSGDGFDFTSELLHARVTYELSDFWKFGEIVDSVDDSQIASARRRHFGLMEADFEFRRDVP